MWTYKIFFQCGCKDGYRYADDECVKCKCAESTTTESPIIPLPRIGITEKVVPTTTVSAHKPGGLCCGKCCHKNLCCYLLQIEVALVVNKL